MSACDYLAILLVDMNEELFEAEVHLLSEAAAAALSALEVKPQKDFEKDHFEAVILEQELAGEMVSVCAAVFLGPFCLLLHFELVNLGRSQNFGAEHEELVSLVFAEGIHDQAFPEYIDL